MRYTELHEHTASARHLPALAGKGWHLAGVMASDGRILWGELVESAIVQWSPGILRASVTYRDGRHGGALNGQLVPLTTPDGGPHRVTLSRGIAEGDVCALCGKKAARPASLPHL